MAASTEPETSEGRGPPTLDGRGARGGGWLRRLRRAYLEREAPRYFLSAGVVLAVMLLVPELLNNMLLTLVVLLLGVAILPEVLRRRL
jgi:Flp pilus assembly protein TadB